MDLSGFLLFRDPRNADVVEAIRGLLALELKVISGVNRHAAPPARTVGLDATEVVTGADVDRLRDEALWHRPEAAHVFAEIDPIQKERVILALKRADRVIGYLGDGINDAPALHAADVGISLDRALDVAKEAADLVLLEHDLYVSCAAASRW